MRSFDLFVRYDLFVDAQEYLLDLVIQFGTVGHDQDTRIGYVLLDPLVSQTIVKLLPLPCECQIIHLRDGVRAAGLRDAKVLVGTTNFSDAMIEDDKFWTISSKRCFEHIWLRCLSSTFAMGLFSSRQKSNCFSVVAVVP